MRQIHKKNLNGESQIIAKRPSFTISNTRSVLQLFSRTVRASQYKRTCVCWALPHGLHNHVKLQVSPDFFLTTIQPCEHSSDTEHRHAHVFTLHVFFNGVSEEREVTENVLRDTGTQRR